MRRADVEPRFGCRLDPSAQNAAAREHKSMCLASVEHRQFKLAVERRGGYRLPLRALIVGGYRSAALR